jgi:hypothetical protein
MQQTMMKALSSHAEKRKVPSMIIVVPLLLLGLMPSTLCKYHAEKDDWAVVEAEEHDDPNAFASS